MASPSPRSQTPLGANGRKTKRNDEAKFDLKKNLGAKKGGERTREEEEKSFLGLKSTVVRLCQGGGPVIGLWVKFVLWIVCVRPTGRNCEKEKKGKLIRILREEEYIGKNPHLYNCINGVL